MSTIGSKVRVDGLEGDLLVEPGVAALRLFALVALNCEALTSLGIGGAAELDEDGLALARALDRSAEEAPGTVGDGWLHGPSDDLGDEHALSQTATGLDCDPLEVVVFDVLPIAEAAGGRL